MEPLNVPPQLALVEIDGKPIDINDLTYFVGREAVRQSEIEGMNPMLEHLFTLLHRGADSADRFFNLPSDRVFEVGTHVDI